MELSRFFNSDGSLKGYADSCALYMQSGFKPQIEPTRAQCERLERVAGLVLPSYIPAADDSPLAGLVVYNPIEQAGSTRYSWAHIVCDGEKAVIGMSTDALNLDMLGFHAFLLSHELAHLSAWEHDETFTIRQTQIFFDFCYKHKIRMDGVAIPKLKHKGWTI